MERRDAVGRFACPRHGCLKDFSRRSILNDHLLAHDDERPHECGECGRKFTRANDLKRHNAGHIRTKRHVCEGCKRTFTRKYALSEHLRSPKYSRCSQPIHTASTTSATSEALRQSDNISAPEISIGSQSHNDALASHWTNGCNQQPSHQGFGSSVTNMSIPLDTTFPLPGVFEDRPGSEDMTPLPIRAKAQEMQFHPLPSIGIPENTLFPNPSLYPQIELSSGFQDLSPFNDVTLPVEKPTVCRLCQRRHDKKTDYRDHIQMHLDDLESRPYRCIKCDISFAWSAALFLHQTQKRCPRFKCSKVFPTHEALGYHLKGQDGSDSCHLAIGKSEEIVKGWLKQELDSVTKAVGVSLDIIWREIESDIWELGDGGFLGLDFLSS